VWRNQANSSRRVSCIYCKASHGSGDDEIEYHHGVSCVRVPGKKIHFTADLRCPTVLCAIGAKAQEKDLDTDVVFV